MINRHLTALFVAFVFAAPTLAVEERYPQHHLLIEPTELTKESVAERFIVLDVRDQAAYDKGHIPTAHRIDHDDWSSAFDGEKDTEGWSKRIGQLGIDENSSVVVYDDNSAKDAARIWWLLRYWGVKDVRLLNGGWRTWKALKLPASQEPARKLKQVEFNATPITKRLADKDQILDQLEGGKLQIVDARSFPEFCGDDAGKNNKGGAIPGAKHLEWSDLIEEKTHRFKSPSEISTLFERAGVDPKHPTATYCQSGGRASVMAFGVELMGGKDVRNYYKGWSEWGNAEETPVDRKEKQE